MPHPDDPAVVRPDIAQRLQRLVRVHDGEAAPLLWSCLYFFCLLAGYYVLRPIRDAMGIAGGTRQLPWLFMGTLGATLLANPLFSALVSRYSRRVFIPVAYHFFALNLLVFFLLLRQPELAANKNLARVFFVWVSVFNLFVVSVFWGFMADVFRTEQGKRLFGVVAIGGTLGAMAGSGLTTLLAQRFEPVNLILLSIALLETAVYCVRRLVARFGDGRTAATAPHPPPDDKRVQGANGDGVPTPGYAAPAAAGAADSRGVWGGLRRTLTSPYLLAICTFMLLYTISSTFLYFEQARIIDSRRMERGEQVAFLARIDLTVNAIGLSAQLLVAGRLISALGVGPVLAILPALTLTGFLALGRFSSLTLLFWVQVLRRATDYALTRPAREVLYTVVPRDEKYKAKNFIDTFVYRAGDALGAGVDGLLTRLAGGPWLLAVVAVPLCLAWLAVGLMLGRRQRALAADDAAPPAVLQH